MPLITLSLSNFQVWLAIGGTGLGCICSLVAIFGFFYKMLDRRMEARDKAVTAARTDGVKEGTLVLQLDGISSTQAVTLKKLDDMCNEQQRQALQTVKDVTEIRGEIKVAVDCAKSAHHRVDGLEIKLDNLTDHVFTKGQYDKTGIPKKE